MAYSREQFKQLANPHGQAGKAMLERLNRVNANINGLALESLGKSAVTDVLEIGFGGGALLADGFKKFPKTRFVGVEISKVAIARARVQFRSEIEAGVLQLYAYDGLSLPFAERAVDTVIAVNVIYFVERLDLFFKDIFRVLRPNGRCVLGYSVGSPDRVTRFEKADVEQMLTHAGFAHTRSFSDHDSENDIFHCTVGFV